MKKILIFLVLALCIFQVSAYFPKSHSNWVINGFNNVPGGIPQECSAYLDVVLDGMNGADAGVIYYGDSAKVGSYIGSHGKGGFTTCLSNVDTTSPTTQLKQRCFCYGDALHIIADSYSHNPGGLVDVYLRKFFGNNYFGHMTIERNFENKHLALIKSRNDYSISSSKLDNYDSNFMNSLFTGPSDNLQPSDLMNLLDKVAGIPMTDTVKIFRSGYQGVGFYDQVYKDKINFPWWMKWLSVVIMVISLMAIILLLVFGNTGWKYITIILWLIIFLIGLILFTTVWFNWPVAPWQLTTYLIEIPPKFGYLSVSEQDVIKYDGLIQKSIDEFLACGGSPDCLTIADASGLSYEKNGVLVEGTLTDAEKGFKRIWYFGVVPLFLILNLFLILKSVGGKVRFR